MPTSPPRACPCGGRIQQGKCDRCNRGKRARDTRGSASSRGYDYQWQKFRTTYLAMYPLCVDCGIDGLVGAAVHIHHIRKLAEHPELKYEESNLMPLCERHHNERTARGE